MEAILFMVALFTTYGLIGVLAFKYGTYVGYDMACGEILEDLKEAENKMRMIIEEELR